jgi:hypothetical protein
MGRIKERLMESEPDFRTYLERVKTIKQCPTCGARYQEEIVKESKCEEHPLTSMEEYAKIRSDR